jgi:hypothetical protein
VEGAVVFWAQAFERSEVARRMEHIVVPANEHNLARAYPLKFCDNKSVPE